jgi:CRP-like cAMP-binding protein
MELSEVMRILEGSEVFRELDRAHLEKIAALCRVQSLQPGEIVLRQGDLEEKH